MQVVQKTTTYNPEEHVDPLLDGRLKLLGRGVPIGTIKSRETNQAFVRRREQFTTILEEGNARPDWVTFTLRDGSNEKVFTQDKRVTNQATMAINVGANGVRNITPSNSLEYSFGLTVRSLSREPRLELLGLGLPQQSKLLQVRRSLQERVVAKLELLVSVELDDQEFNMELNDLAITLISATHLNTEYETSSSRTRIVSRACEAVRNTDPRNLSPGLIANMSYTSVRTLEYAFREILEMTPKQYIDYYRVNLLRERLIAAPEIPILQLGDEVGLPHLGNLSRNYRNLYNETPSATKKRLAKL